MDAILEDNFEFVGLSDGTFANTITLITFLYEEQDNALSVYACGSSSTYEWD